MPVEQLFAAFDRISPSSTTVSSAGGADGGNVSGINTTATPFAAAGATALDYPAMPFNSADGNGGRGGGPGDFATAAAAAAAAPRTTGGALQYPRLPPQGHAPSLQPLLQKSGGKGVSSKC